MSTPTAVFAKFEERRIKRDAERMSLNKRLAELAAEGERDQVAFQVFKSMYPSDDVTEADPSRLQVYSSAKPNSIEPAPSPVVARQQGGASLTAKEMILSILRDAVPDGLTANQIRGKAQIRFKADLNPNTLTVTLVRASKGADAKVECRKKVWFYIRETSGVDTMRIFNRLNRSLSLSEGDLGHIAQK